MLNFSVCVCVCVRAWCVRAHACACVGQGDIFVAVFNAVFSNSVLNSKSFSCQTNRIWKNIFFDNIFNANIFI